MRVSISDIAVWANTTLSDLKPLNIVICLVLLWSLLWQVSRFLRPRTTKLSGPSSESWIFGQSKALFEADDTALLYEDWAQKYGPVYRIPLSLGSSRIVLCDPRAVAHFYARESTGFRMKTANRILIERLVCFDREHDRLH